jgi:HEAT repeat protein
MLLASAVRPAEPDLALEDAATIKAGGLTTDAASLSNYLRKRVGTEETRAKAKQLAQQLGDEDFDKRERASKELLGLGAVAVPALREALNSRDAEIQRRARECLDRIESETTRRLSCAVIRQLAAHKTAGAAELLLDYLPFAEDDTVVEEAIAALALLAVRDSKPEPALMKALADRNPAIRTAAVDALCRADVKDAGSAVRKLLADPDLSVRLRAARGLVSQKDAEAVPILIDLLGRLPTERGWEVEDLLARLAGDKAPARPAGTDAAAMTAWRTAWLDWWKANQNKVDLGELGRAPRYLGYRLIVLLDSATVLETDREGKTRWEFGGLKSPLDARVLPGDRVLVTEAGSGVSERNIKGEVLWEKKFDGESPIAAQRLPNGNTFIVLPKRLVEVRRDGSEAASIKVVDSVTTAQRLPDGRAFVVSGSRCLLLDSTGKEVRGFAIPGGVQTTSSLSFENLPAGNVLLVDYGGGAVREYDTAGKVIWEGAVARPISAWRLPNGNTLVSTQDHAIVEMNRAGKEIGKTDSLGHPTRVRAR